MKALSSSLRIQISAKPRFNQRYRTGFSLVELLVALALMGLVSLAIANLLIKSNVTSSSLNSRFREATEIQAMIDDIRDDFHKGVYISNNSFNNRLDYTTYDTSGNAVKKIYGICYYSATPASTDTSCPVSSVSNTIPYLKLSTDGGTTWGSPYKLAAFNKYKLTSTASFKYLDAYNGCTHFLDDNGDGVWTTSETANVNYSCYPSSGSISYPPDFPSQSSRVVLEQFTFTTGTGSPEVIRDLPDIFIKANPGLVRSYASVASPGVQDTIYVNKILTTSSAYNTNAFFNANNFDLRGVAYDSSRNQLITVGNYTAAPDKIFVTDRMGIILGSPYKLDGAGSSKRSVALDNNGNNIFILTRTGSKVNRYNLSGSSPLSLTGTLDLASPTVLVGNNPSAIAFDPSTPSDIYVLAVDPSATSTWKIFEINFNTRVIVTTWTLPAAFNAFTTPGGGLAIEPTTGDFLVTMNTINGTSPNATIDLYRIQRSNAAVYSGYPMTIPINRMGSTATSTDGNNGVWQLAYDPILNRLFLADGITEAIFEIVPDRLISPVK